jgi:hypothetical protein
VTRPLSVRLAAVFAIPLVATALLLIPARALAADPAVVYGTVTATAGDVRLPGVEVLVVDSATGRTVRTTFSDGAGQYRFEGLAAGRYQVVARLPGFTDRTTAPLTLTPGSKREVPLALDLAPVSETVRVQGEAGIARPDESSTKETLGGRLVDALPVASDSYRSLLPVLPGVVRQPDGRISLKGARPTQGTLSVGAGSGVDPSTGNFGIELPSDAVESVNVVPNPYASEEGRFSAGLVRVETRAGTDAVDVFTRVDAHPAPGHALTATFALFPRRLLNATINTFTPEEVSPDIKSWGYNVAVSDAATLSPRTVLASFFSSSLYDAEPGRVPAGRSLSAERTAPSAGERISPGRRRSALTEPTSRSSSRTAGDCILGCWSKGACASTTTACSTGRRCRRGWGSSPASSRRTSAFSAEAPASSASAHR